MANFTHIGPRGGRYRVENGKKVYDVPYEEDRIQQTPTGSALLAEADDAPGEEIHHLWYVAFYLAVFCPVFGWWAINAPLQVLLLPIRAFIWGCSHPLISLGLGVTAFVVWLFRD